MERKFVFQYDVVVWAKLLFLVSCFAASSHGDYNVETGLTMKEHTHAKDAIFETIEIDGEIIDCVDIYKQPAFNHPMLFNHTIQMVPTHYPEKIRTNDGLVGESHPWRLPRSCPKGSIPIRRSQRGTGDYAGHLHRYLLDRQGEVQSRNDLVAQNFEAADVFIKRANYNGGRATINVWNPKVEVPQELSASLIGVTMKDNDDIHLHAGWLVFPELYSSNRSKTRFFIRWTTKGFEPLCYNLRCPGFVQTNTRIILDSSLEPVSDYEGAQYAIDVAISKDKNTGNWWVYLQGSAMGYWPKDLSSGLGGSAVHASFSGEIYNSKPGGEHTSTEMGSGHFSSEGFRKASFFRNVEIYDDHFRYVSPSAAGDITVAYEHPHCYDARTVGGTGQSGAWGYYFFYGGPGKAADKCS